MERSRKAAGNSKFFETYSWYVPGFGGLVGLLMLILLGVVLGNLMSLCFLAVGGQEFAEAYGQLISYPLLFVPAMIYAGLKSRTNAPTRSGFKLDSNHFGKTGGVVCAIVLVFATIALSFCTDAMTTLLPPIPDRLKSLLEGMTQGPVVINFILVSIMAPFFEEWLCRGMVLRGLLGRNVKPVWAIVTSALFFALIHANPWQAVPAFIIGCFFGFIYYKTGSLKLTMLMHFTFNSFSLLIGHIDAVKDCETWQEVLPSGPYWVIFAACVLLVVLVVRLFSRIECLSSQGNCDPVPPLFGEEKS